MKYCWYVLEVCAAILHLLVAGCESPPTHEPFAVTQFEAAPFAVSRESSGTSTGQDDRSTGGTSAPVEAVPVDLLLAQIEELKEELHQVKEAANSQQVAAADMAEKLLHQNNSAGQSVPRNAPPPSQDVKAGQPVFRCVMWSPSWCMVCIANANHLKKYPDLRAKVEIRKGDEKSFPVDVQNYANGVHEAGTTLAGQQRGWPVWQIQQSDGTWRFYYNARTASDLVKLHNLKAGEPAPASTFGREAK